MLTVSIIIPAWNESERIVNCLRNATRQTLAPHEVIVVDNKSTDNTCAMVQQFIDENPQFNVILLHQDEEQGLIPTRNYGLNHATGDILGRIDADTMLKPDWVEVVTGIFTEDPEAMGASGPVVYYDMPARKLSLKTDNHYRKRSNIKDARPLLFGSNMTLRATAWKQIADEVCRDKADVMHEDVDITLHMEGHGLKTVYSPRMIAGMSARRMDTSLSSFRRYMKRFKNTFDAHPQHTRKSKPEYLLTSLYPILHLWFPVYQKYLDARDIDPAERIWLQEQMDLAEENLLDDSAFTEADLAKS
jgi:glycosyltransferase involved in cell wall biosynthesis